MSSQQGDTARVAWLLLTVGFLLGPAFFGWPEVVYLFNGRDAQAEVQHGYEDERWTPTGGGGTREVKVRAIEFTFVEPDGTRRTGKDTLAADATVKRGDKVGVRYTPGTDGMSRLAGNINWRLIAVFVVGVISAVALVWHLVWVARREKSERAESGNSERGVAPGIG